MSGRRLQPGHGADVKNTPLFVLFVLLPRNCGLHVEPMLCVDMTLHFIWYDRRTQWCITVGKGDFHIARTRCCSFPCIRLIYAENWISYMKRRDCCVCQLLLWVFEMEIIMRCHVLYDCVCVGVPFSPQIDCIDFILRIRNHHGAKAAHPLQSMLVLSTYVCLSVSPSFLVHMCLRIRFWMFMCYMLSMRFPTLLYSYIHPEKK